MSADALIAGRYRLVAEVGRGGMGRVWRAYDELLCRAVAVKEVRFPVDLEAADRERLAGRTLREARAVAAVDTPAAVRVFDIVEQDGRPWIVMELVEGGTLTDLLRTRAALPSTEVARIGLAVLEALEAAHAAGVLHRDVKPSNILIGDDGRVALTDFGIATVDGDSSIGDTTSGVIVGSPSYVAPERARGHRPTAASDLWSLGATLWTAAEGRPPYEGATGIAVMSSVMTDDPPRCTRCAGPLAAIIRGLMDRDPAARPPATEVRAVLTQVLHGSEVAEDRPAVPSQAALPASFDRTTVLAAPPSDTAPGRRRRGPLLAVAVALGLAAVGAGIAITLAGRSSPPTGRAGAATHPSATSRHRSSSSASTTAAALPTGWSRYTDPQVQWSVGVPAGWTRSTSQSGTMFSDPAGGRYFLVATRYPAGSSALAAWQDSERSFRATHSDYHRIELRTVPVAGARDAADWEFTYLDGGASLRALDQGMVYGDRGYALYLQSHTDEWDASQGLFEQVERSFRHGSTGA